MPGRGAGLGFLNTWGDITSYTRVALGRSVRYHNQFGISVSRALGIQDPPKRIDTYPKLMDACPKLYETCPQNLGTIPENGRKEIAQHANSLYIGPEGPYMGPWGPWVPMRPMGPMGPHGAHGSQNRFGSVRYRSRFGRFRAQPLTEHSPVYVHDMYILPGMSISQKLHGGFEQRTSS